MLIILTTHPIQYQVPLWQSLSRDGRISFELWYLSDHATRISLDNEFGASFAWDLDMLAGYPHQFLSTPPGARPDSFWKCRLQEQLRNRLLSSGARVLWIQGWQVAGYWQAVREARAAGIQLWLRGESNDLARIPQWKRVVKRLVLSQLFRRIDHFLTIGKANRRLYRKFGVSPGRLHPAPYAVDNERFATQSGEYRKQRSQIRARWGIAEDAFCVLFCGKFIPKKRPMDVVAAGKLLEADSRLPRLHLLFVGAGEMGLELRNECQVVYDQEGSQCPSAADSRFSPRASFTGFLNQNQISMAYAAADCLVLPSDFGETWGLVVNEAMASGLPCVISDRCGCAEDLGAIEPNRVFPYGNIESLAEHLFLESKQKPPVSFKGLDEFSFRRTVETVVQLYGRCTSP